MASHSEVSRDGRNTRKIIGLLQQLLEEKFVAGVDIVNPWDTKISPLEKAQYHLDLLGATYGGGHPGSLGSVKDVLDLQTSGQLLTWFAFYYNQPVAMANCEISENGVADLVRTVELPTGTVLSDGSNYGGQVRTGYVMYQRIIDLLTNPRVRDSFWVIEADLRLAREMLLPESKLVGGERTQHINFQYQMYPWLLSVPRYQVHPKGNSPHQEVFWQSRVFTQPKGVDQGPYYLPEGNTKGFVSMAEIVRATTQYAWGESSKIISNVSSYPESSTDSSLVVEPTGGPHFWRIFLSGIVALPELEMAIQEALENTRFVEVIVPNGPENILTHQILEKSNLVPLGVMPGGNFSVNKQQKKIKTTFHYGIARPDIVNNMVELTYANDHQNSPVVSITDRLREQWRRLGTK